MRAATGNVQKEYLLRTLSFCVLTLVVNILLILFSFRFRSDHSVSLLGFGKLGSIPIRTATAILILGCIGLAGSIAPLVKRLKVEVNVTFYITATGVVSALILWAAVGSIFDMVGLVALSLRLSTPIVLGAMAGMLCERTGVVNIAIEGMMLTAACVGFAATVYLNSLWLGLLCAILAGSVMAALHAFLSVSMITDQIVSGTVINILAVGLTGFIRRSFLVKAKLSRTAILPIISIPLLSKIPILGTIFFTNQPIVFFMMILVVLLTIAFFKTRWGLRTRAIGEHPEAADTVGINVFRMKYLNVMLGGAVAGLAGAWFSLETTGSFDDMMTNGKGFIALAAMIFGKWHPVGAFIGGLIFGFSDALQIIFQIKNIPIPFQFLWMMPYLITMIVLAGVIGKSTPPAADGEPYIKR
ncbi:MAG: ABC transporter permease [Spirochaetales bacterium]|nr:ABC transporter permease [Spirochaetales bacterium]